MTNISVEAVTELANKLIQKDETIMQLVKELKWVAQTIHQAYHEKGTYETCMKNTCDAINQAISKVELEK